VTTLHRHPTEHSIDAVLVTPETFEVGAARRSFDIAAAAVLLVLCLPILAAAALLVKLTDGGAVLFRQERLGEGGTTFRLVKLRTMRSGEGPGVTATGDPRITRVGRVLRRTSVDELPQLWHVLCGQMTLVGPRPESVALAAAYPASCRFVLAARPGLTGPAQLRYRESAASPPAGMDVESWYLTRLVPLRVAADLDFLIDPTMTRTLLYVWRTALFVVGLHDASGPETPGPATESRSAS
jgi:lipopolysaccharide/colanic/teichoic acid biosynthesis glycosyltransferase